jgi:2-keto-4-pentenoate hydratase/2-oxohepta-3-ene-1,7-dioic acid hydratase in catechol pathway
LPVPACFWKGAVAGDKIFDAGALCRGAVVDMTPVDDGEKRKMIMPNAKRPPNIRVNGLCLRSARATAMLASWKVIVSRARTVCNLGDGDVISYSSPAM